MVLAAAPPIAVCVSATNSLTTRSLEPIGSLVEPLVRSDAVGQAEPVRAVVCERFGPVEDLVVRERDEPVPGPGQVRIDVEACGVNFVDALFVGGRYQIKPPTPFVPGSEIAGVISALGARTDGPELAVGQRVLASPGLGGFAEQVVVGADAVAAVPPLLDAPSAATFNQSYSTALFSLRERGNLRADETVLVLGAGGGVGLAMIDVARMMGARVLAVASTPEKRALAEKAGADASVDPSAMDAKQAARDWSGGGIDVAVDPVGGGLAEQALRSLGERGRLLVIGFASGDIPALPANQILLRNRSVIGVDWGAWAMAHNTAQRELLDELLDAVAQGHLHPVAPAVYPLDRAADALSDLLSRRVAGKVVLVPSRSDD